MHAHLELEKRLHNFFRYRKTQVLVTNFYAVIYHTVESLEIKKLKIDRPKYILAGFKSC